MAKFVIAGCADCPYFARVELLGDTLKSSLDEFYLHKIVKKPNEWESWLKETCDERGWMHSSSPLVWRELVDRGGKGVLIGGANEFQEYANCYYSIETDVPSRKLKLIAEENLKTKLAVDEEENERKECIKPLRICITNASNPVCYNLIAHIAQGDVFGPNTHIALHLFDTEDMIESLEGLQMEAQDLSLSLLLEIIITTNSYQAFMDCDAIIILGTVPRKPSDKTGSRWMKKNAELAKDYATAINEVADKHVKVIVATKKLANFITSIIIENAPNIARQNIVAACGVVENKTRAVIAQKVAVNAASVVDVIIWGDPTGSFFVDTSKTRVHNYNGAIVGPDWYSIPAQQIIYDNKWLERELATLIQERTDKMRSLLGRSTCLASVRTVCLLLKYWWHGSPPGQILSLGVHSEGWYGVPNGMVFSFPIIMHPKGYWMVVEDVDVTEDTKAVINSIVKDLQEQKESIMDSIIEDEEEPSEDSLTEPPSVEKSSQSDTTVGQPEQQVTDPSTDVPIEPEDINDTEAIASFGSKPTTPMDAKPGTPVDPTGATPLERVSKSSLDSEPATSSSSKPGTPATEALNPESQAEAQLESTEGLEDKDDPVD